MTSRIEISTLLYEQCNGHKPRGFRLWYFRLRGGRTFCYSGTYVDARRALCAHAFANSEKRPVHIQVVG